MSRRLVSLAAISCLSVCLHVGAVAQAAPGDLDTQFSGDGLQTLDLGPGSSVAAAVARQPDGKILAAGTNNGGAFALARYNADGSLDSSFSGDGRQTAYFGAGTGFSTEGATELAVQPNGKIVVAGSFERDFAVARFNSDGSLDTTFSDDGRQTTDIGSTPGANAEDQAADVAIQTDGRIVVVGMNRPAFGANGSDFALVRYTPDGSLDTTFSGDGKLTTDFGGLGNGDLASGVAVQTDGKLLVVGTAGELSGSGDFGVARYEVDGALDLTYSSDGKQTVDFGVQARASDITLQPDGKAVAVGVADNSGFALARLDTEGTLDTTFSADGKETTSFGFGFARATGVAVQADGKIVAAGNQGLDFAVARYNPDGSLDPTFSEDGKQTTPVGSGSGSAQAAEGIVLQPDGKLVAAGVATRPDFSTDFALARYNIDGSLDTGFSTDGRQTTEFAGFDEAKGVAVQEDGKVVAVAGGKFGADFTLTRYNGDGSLDTSFSGDGRQNTDFGNGSRGANGLALQPDGKILVVGTGLGPTGADFAVARYNTDGSLDPTFSGDGIQITDVDGSFEDANGVTVQPDGKIIVVGVTGSTDDFGLVRYNADGSLDTTFSGDGKLTTDFGVISSDGGAAVVVQPDGRIVAVGGGTGAANVDFAVARYDADGSLDTTFSEDGKQTTDFGGSGSDNGEGAAGVALQPDGKIVAAGAGGPGLDFALARYQTDGSLDATFSGDGTQSTDFGPKSGGASGLGLQADGRIVAAGAGNGGEDFAVARYGADGALDSTFSGDGKVTTDFAGSVDQAKGVALQADGNIIAAGGATNDSRDVALVRYEGGGVSVIPDTTSPETTISEGPAQGASTADATPTFSFSSSEGGSTFACRVDGGAPFACSSPYTLPGLAGGQHTFMVAATDAALNADITPATRTFTVQAPAITPPGDTTPPSTPPAPAPIVQPAPPAPRPTTAPQPPGPVAVGDVRAPTAKLSGSRSVKLGKSVSVRVACTSERCTSRTSGSVRVPKSGRTRARTFRLKVVTKTIARGRAATVKLSLSKTVQTAIRRSLRQGRSISVKLRVVVSDAAGNDRTLTRTLKLKR